MNLSDAIRETKGLLCLQCVLADCDEDDPLCLYREAKGRKTYWREYYQTNREKKIQAAKERQQANCHDHVVAVRRYRARKQLNQGEQAG